jgi:hypothetical protein
MREINMTRIRYNKERLSSKQLGGGGPRDRQAALKLRQQRELFEREALAEVPKQQEIDLSQYLPFDEVRVKIADAVTSTIASERKKFEGSLKDLKDQLYEKDVVISKLRSELDTESSRRLEELKSKLDKLYDRISDGSIQHLVGSKMARPALEDKIFIDPIEKSAEPKLDSHIDIKEDKSSKTDSERDINTDLAKLRNLLKL